MNPDGIISELEANKAVFRQLLTVPEAFQKWRPANGSWCLLEIICHLKDEECEDFRARIRLALQPGLGSLVPIHPVKWVTERRYINNSFQDVLDNFLEERGRSINWLRSLEQPDWESDFLHTELGPMTAFSMLANWLAHDYHHIRQVNTLKYFFLKDQAGTDLGYAGNW